MDVGVRERMGSRSRWLLKFPAWAVGEMAESFTVKGCPGS